MNGEYVKAYVLDAPFHIDIPFDYYVPAELHGLIKVGDFVTVPFGRGNRNAVTALVAALSSVCDYKDANKVKPVLAVSSDRFSLDEKMLGLALFLKERTLCTVGEAVRTMLPVSAFSRAETFYVAVKNFGGSLTAKEKVIFNAVSLAGRISARRIASEGGEEAQSLLCRLVAKGAVLRDFEIKEPTNNKYQSRVMLVADEKTVEEALTGKGKNGLRGEKQRLILSELARVGEYDEKALLAASGGTKAQLASLEKRGLVKTEKSEIFRNPYADIKIDKEKKNVLSPIQTAAFERLRALYASGKPSAALLYGVTGSGKTRVIKSMIDEVVAGGRSVIVLVPEISLTPQTVTLFCSFYGERVAVLHSALSAGERFDAYKRIREGRVDVVIGTRSAVFSPLKNLGMIVIDEEQEHTYKSDMNPKYHARDVASFRCGQENALLLLASATPSVESFYRAREGNYLLVELPERYGGATLPEVRVCDMREELRAGVTSPLGRELSERLTCGFSDSKQSILFINRRGYNNFVTCPECGETMLCPHCSVSLTYHKGDGGGYLSCHYCGYRTETPRKCPSCGGDKIRFMGFGTQKAEEEIKLLLPSAEVMRMDADTTGTKEAYDRLLSEFRERGDVLIGTQMVTKGHDFPRVTLVGVLLADASLYLDDYRANERTFSLITQVVGRAGRAEYRGVAVVQTYKPENEALKLAVKGNYTDFYEKEIKNRKEFLWPPYCDIALLSLQCNDEAEAGRAAVKLSARFSELAGGEYKDLPFVAFGPFEAPVYKVNGSYRLRMVIKCKLNRKCREMFAKILSEFTQKLSKKCSLSIDFNPTSI